MHVHGLLAALVVWGGCSLVPAPTRAPAPRAQVPRAAPDTAPPARAEVAAVAEAVIARANAVRADVAAPPLREVPALTIAAQEYARELAARQRLDHTSPTPGRATMTERIEVAGGTWQRAAENLASTSGVMLDVPRMVVELWLTSAGHRRNLLDPGFTTTGVGVARDRRGHWYVVQLYVLPPPRR